MGHVQSGNIIVVSLPSPDSEEGVEVIKSFQMGGNVVHGRVIVGGKKRRRNGRKNGIDPEAVHEVVAEEDDMEVDAVPENEDEDNEDKDDEDEEKEEVAQKEEQSWISCLGASGDGQWLASGDTAGRVTIFNLDTLQVSPEPFLHPLTCYIQRGGEAVNQEELMLIPRSTVPSPTSLLPPPPSYSHLHHHLSS